MVKRKAKPNAQILEEASSWFIDFNEGEVAEAAREEFNAWLRTSPEHVRAYLKISAFWEDAGKLDKRPDLDMDALVARAFAEQNVFPLEGGNRARAEPQGFAPLSANKVRMSLAFAATLLFAVGVSIVMWNTFFRAPIYTTEIGEQRSIPLEDGSSVELNSRSRLKVSFTEDVRAVELLEGQALFRVAKNAKRPFVVLSGRTSVRVVGTQFDVYRKSSGTIVTVVEGKVAVVPKMPAGSSAAETYVSAGQQLTVTLSSASPPKPANVAIATAWTEKKLVFESTPLKEVVEEFNRYNRRQLVIRDPELYDFHVSGVFPSTDSSRMIEFLRQRFGVTLGDSRDAIEISRRTNIS